VRELPANGKSSVTGRIVTLAAGHEPAASERSSMCAPELKCGFR
jgi:hypothetical protein